MDNSPLGGIEGKMSRLNPERREELHEVPRVKVPERPENKLMVLEKKVEGMFHRIT